MAFKLIEVTTPERALASRRRDCQEMVVGDVQVARHWATADG